jgi:hypothetical protein
VQGAQIEWQHCRLWAANSSRAPRSACRASASIRCLTKSTRPTPRAARRNRSSAGTSRARRKAHRRQGEQDSQARGVLERPLTNAQVGQSPTALRVPDSGVDFRLDRAKVERGGSLHRRELDGGIPELGHDLLDEDEPRRQRREPPQAY